MVISILIMDFEKKKMSVTQKQGIITCIPKDEKDKQFIQKLEVYYFTE